MTSIRPPIEDLQDYDIVTKSIILLEEGLELKTDNGKLQANLILMILGNIGKASKDIANRLYSFGAIETFMKWFEQEDLNILRNAITAFSKLNLTDNILGKHKLII